jgi:hypothetical protein
MKASLLALLTCLTLVVVSAASDITGTWEVDASFDDSSLQAGGFDCVFKQDGERLTGKCSGGTAEVAGEVKGQNVSWRLARAGTSPETPTLTFTGTLDQAATSMNGRFTIGDKGGSFTAVKQ